jgi:hypothetical protein
MSDPIHDFHAGLARTQEPGLSPAERGEVLLVTLRAGHAAAVADPRAGPPMLAALAAHWAAIFERLDRRVRERQAEAARQVTERAAELAAEHDGPAVALDGGPSTLGAAEWIQSVERWAQERR